MEVASEIMKGVVQVLMVPVKKQLDYLISYKKYVEDMRTKMKDLDVARLGVESQKKQNRERRLEVPAQVDPWLIEVEQMNEKVADFPSEVPGCLDFKSRHKLGRKAFKIFKEIESVLGRCPEIRGTELQIPVGRIDSIMASSSTPSSDHNDFQSREQTFTKALEALGPNHSSHMVALCGMGGVGKTTMMKKLKEVVVGKKMFNHYVEAVIGEKTDPIAIQQAVAEYLGISLTETTKSARTDKLRKWFSDNSDGGKKKFLVILDDVWQSVDMEDIGLSRLPNQGVDFKVLITSRDQAVCSEMGVKADSVLKVSVLEEAEAHNLFLQFLEPSDDVDPELHKIGEEIVRKCCGLPIAIKTMACTLRSKSKDTWKNALSRLQHHDINTIAPTVFQTSYDNIQDEVTKATFLLCGLFPEDFNIPTEDLLRYGWGLKLFKGVGTIREARYKMNACIERLMHTNLLIEGHDAGCVKMHDLVRAFVLDMFSKVEHASIVNHGSSKPGWPETENDVSSSCKRISLTCKGMIEFPGELKFPNVSILKLMHGDKSLRFPRNFYEEMGQLQVVSYDHMIYPLLSSSLECSTNLRVLLLQRCLLTFDLSSIGNLPNLEVLSFAYSAFNRLPSTIGNLKKLRVLDVTCCGGHHIDNGVFKNLVRLEELWASGGDISFTGDDCNEVAERWKNLSALEFEFHENNAQPKNLSFENLERFKISMGRSLRGEYLMESKHSFENTLKLVTNKGDVLESRINELFEKTVMLCLRVEDMNNLEDVAMKSSLRPLSSSFWNVRILVVSECPKLKYLFTLGVAKVLSNLEYLEVFNCLVMKELIHLESGGEERVTFPKLTSLSLSGLPRLLGLCWNVNIIALPHLMELKIEKIPNITSIYSKNKWATSCLFRGEVLNPMLERLHIERMENLKEIWPCDFQTSEEVKLREIEVENCKNLVNIFPCNPMPLMCHLKDLKVERCGSIEALFNVDLDCVASIEKGSINLRRIEVILCDKLVDLFPCNPMPLLHHLEELKVDFCGSIEALFNIDLDCVGETGEEGGTNSLRSINVRELGKLQEVWRIKGGENNSGIPIRGFQSVESICIRYCKRFRNVFSPTTTNFDLGALTSMAIFNSGEIWRKYGLVESSQGKENTLFPPCLINSCHNLRNLELGRCEGVEVIFEMKSTPRSQDNAQRILPNLEKVRIWDVQSMSHVWKCNWNEFLVLHGKPSESPFHNLKIIKLDYCRSIKYLFSPLMAKLLSNLKRVHIQDCYGMEEVISNRDNEHEEKITSTSTHTKTALFPLLDTLTLRDLQNLKCIGGGGAKSGNNEISFNSTTTTTVSFLDQYKFPQGGGVSWTLCQYPREIKIWKCNALSSVIPCYAAGNMQKLQVMSIFSCHGMKEVFETQRISNNVIMLELRNLKRLEIEACDLLEHIFTFSTLESLVQLEELTIKSCKAMKVIVVKAEEHGVQQTTMASSSKVVVFPRLKVIKLQYLPELVGFFLGTNEFQWPSLEKVTIDRCPQMKVFTAGGSTAPQLKYVETSLGKHSPECWFNSHHVTTTTTGQLQESTSFSCPTATSEVIHWSFHNLIELCVEDHIFAKKIVPSSELLQLQKLEKIQVSRCDSVEEVFEALEGTNSGFDESSQTTTTLVKLPNLTQVEFESLHSLRHIWKSNQCIVFEFPNLKRLSIERCGMLEHVFSTSMVGSVLQLQELHILNCSRMEGVFVQDGNIIVEEEEESDGKMNEILLPRLKSLELYTLPCLMYIWKCNRWTLFGFPNLTTVRIACCDSLQHVFNSSMVGSLFQLQELHITNCKHMEEVFVQDGNIVVEEEEEESNGKMNEILFGFPNLTTVCIAGCDSLQHVFSSSMVGSLKQLQEISISRCRQMEEVIVKDANIVVEEEKEESDGKMSELMLPRLKSLKLDELPCLKGFCIGKADFSFPLLDTLTIKKCTTITTFTMGNSSTPELKGIETGFGSFYVEEDINSFIKMKQVEFNRDLKYD